MSLYQKGVFVIRGLQQFSKNGYKKASKHFNESDLHVDVTGKVFLITGANSGLGKSTAIDIAKLGGEVHLVCRNLERANIAKNEIIEASNNQNIHVHELDLSHTTEVYHFVKKFTNDIGKLNVLINNAGCMVNERKLIGDLETNFATNTLGTYVLTRQLLPLLKSTANSRVITVSSGGMYLQKLNIDDLQSKKGTFDGEMAYAQNKRQQVILTEEWAKQNPTVHFSSMHPGWAATPAVQNSMPDFYERMKDRFRTPAEGADTIVWLGVSETAMKEKSGLFYQDRKPVSLHLPLAWTRESTQDRQKFLQIIEDLANNFQPSQ